MWAFAECSPFESSLLDYRKLSMQTGTPASSLKSQTVATTWTWTWWNQCFKEINFQLLFPVYLQICLPPRCFSCDKAKIPLNHDCGGVGVETGRKTLPMLISHSEHDLDYFSISHLQGITKMTSTNILPETDFLDQIWNDWYFSEGETRQKALPVAWL